MLRRKLGKRGLEVSALGLGCMGMSVNYGPPRDKQEMIALMRTVVRHGDDLYVRSVNGRSASWFRGTQVRHEGRIQAGGINKEVTFVGAAPDLNDQIDAVYRSKYRRYAASIINSIVSPTARSATIKLVPRSTHS